MVRSWRSRRGLRFVSIAIALCVAIWQVGSVLAQAPQPNPLAPVPPGNPIFAPVPGVDITANGPAASIHGDPGSGRILFARNCVTCHNDRGVGGIANPGSEDGTVPPLNPLDDPGFVQDVGGDPAAFAKEIDLFVQHGSRPAGDDPVLSMVGWGDHKLLSQQDLADIQAYVMQLNGVYWPDRWAPPAQIRMDASQSGDTITYTINLVNHGSSVLGNLDLTDTLPPGLTYVTSYVPGPGQNPGKVTNGTVEWQTNDGVPQGGTLGPFTIVAKLTATTVPANVVALSFTWATWDGTVYPSSAVSEPSVPGKKSSEPPPFSLTPVITAVATATPLPTSAQGSATSTPAAGAANPTPARAPATPTHAPAPATPTPVPAAPAPTSAGVQIVELDVGALSWGFRPPSITIRVGDSVLWTNMGSLQHTVTSDDGSFDSGLLDPGTTWTMTFNTAGTYSYHCAPHPWMKGTIVVQGS